MNYIYYDHNPTSILMSTFHSLHAKMYYKIDDFYFLIDYFPFPDGDIPEAPFFLIYIHKYPVLLVFVIKCQIIMDATGSFQKAFASSISLPSQNIF